MKAAASTWAQALTEWLMCVKVTGICYDLHSHQTLTQLNIFSKVQNLSTEVVLGHGASLPY